MHSFPIRVYYEDTDLAGIVYYANYLKFIERGRSEWLREMGLDQGAMQREGMVFVVRRVEADYHAPARFEDLLAVESALRSIGGSRIVMDQRVLCDGRLLFSAVVTLVCINGQGRPLRVPAPVRALFPPGT